MAFILEDLTDEQREQMGFAKTRDDIKLPNGKKCKFVDRWVVDKDNNIFLVRVGMSTQGPLYDFEMHWSGEVILIRNLVKEKLWSKPKDESNTCKYDTTHQIIQITIPDTLEDKLDKIKESIRESFVIFGHGNSRYNGNSEVDFTPKMNVEFKKNIKSKIRVADHD